MKTVAEDRFKLAKKVGEKLDLQCKSCGSKQRTKMNDIKAEENKVMSLIASGIFFLGTIALLILIWDYLLVLLGAYAVSSLLGVLVIPFMVYQAMNSSQRERINYFNVKIYG